MKIFQICGILIAFLCCLARFLEEPSRLIDIIFGMGFMFNFLVYELSLNLVEKWRKIREAEKYAWKFHKPKLIARY